MQLFDFHNHWDGVLPVNTLIRIYRNNFSTSSIDSEMKLMGIPSSAKKKNFNNIVGLFARLTLRIHEKYIYDTFPEQTKKGAMVGGKLDGGEIFAYIKRGVPSRGAHMYQHMMIYLTAVNVLIGGDVDKEQMIYSKEAYGFFDTEQKNQQVRFSVPIRYTEILLRNFYNEVAHGRITEIPGMKAICKRGVMKYLKATKISPFDDAFVARSAFKQMWSTKSKDNITELWNVKTAEYLSDNTRGKLEYIEMSQPLKKIPWNCKYPKSYGYTLKWLALIATHREPMGGIDALRNVAESHIRKAAKAVGSGDLIGIDLAGCEGFKYKQKPSNELITICLDELHKRSKKLGFKFNPVLRIHVGEGAGTSDEGWSYIERAPVGYVKSLPEFVKNVISSGEKGELTGKRLARKVLSKIVRATNVSWGNEPKNFGVTAKIANDEDRETSKEIANRANNNIKVVLNSILSYYKKNTEAVKSSNVKIRFGHVTHLDKDRAKQMKECGISGDFNLSSNLRTGVFGVLTKFEDADDLKKSGGRWNDIVKNLEKLEQHGIVHLIKEGGLWVLGTDGQGVEVTDLESEYKGYFQLYKKIKENDDAYVKLQDNIKKIRNSYKKERSGKHIGVRDLDHTKLKELAKKL